MDAEHVASSGMFRCWLRSRSKVVARFTKDELASRLSDFWRKVRGSVLIVRSLSIRLSEAVAFILNSGCSLKQHGRRLPSAIHSPCLASVGCTRSASSEESSSTYAPTVATALAVVCIARSKHDNATKVVLLLRFETAIRFPEPRSSMSGVTEKKRHMRCREDVHRD